ncbi:MAG: NADH-quinone oxidoreductase subunit J [Planctomycetes bacterium]|nr:NADH-quinone oxidoreductase subunit J [Planctomycetota bacterium]MBM4083225.1 NADH-quinone oxidoreductase subunit J [Planctomycetota bacterium]
MSLSEFLAGYGAYYLIIGLILIGIGGLLLKSNYFKKAISLTILQSAIILFYVMSATKRDATVPVIDAGLGAIQPEQYINPLPHTLMLTAIVVSVATSGVAIALLMLVYRRFGTLEEGELLERMR